MAFKGFDAEYETALALVYSKVTGKLVGVRCSQPYY